jgi:MinD-like ATPase involved in chromosome partitioning or flagellar assembly
MHRCVREEPVLIACWSAKGGCGTTVVTVALAHVLARTAGESVVADLAGDVPAVLGLPEPSGPGLGDWLAAGDSVPPGALGRLEVAGPAGIRMLPKGAELDAVPGRGDVLAALLAADARPVVADCGAMPTGARLALAAGATDSLLVMRPCYLALRRAAAFPLRPSAVVLVDEPNRNLTAHDVESVLNVPVRAVVDIDPEIAKAVDAGSFGSRLPRRLERSLRHAA